MKFPSAIIFVNSNMNNQLQTTLEKQLYIHVTLTGEEFDTLISNDPSYIEQVNLNDLRILVIRSDLFNTTNRNLADVVIHVSKGMANVEKNKFGPPISQLTIQNLNIYELLRAGSSDKVATITNYYNNCSSCSCCCSTPAYKGNEVYDPSGVHCPNFDNKYNNEDWLNRN